MNITTANEDETRALGVRIGELVKPGTVIGLSGALGTGKTRLTQGIGKGLGIDPSLIVSPTYTICIPYQGRLPLLHLDVYRIEDETEIDELGLDELVEEGAVIVIEWAEKMKSVLPPLDIEIFIDHREAELEGRTIRLSEHGKNQILLTNL